MTVRPRGVGSGNGAAVGGGNQPSPGSGAGIDSASEWLAKGKVPAGDRRDFRLAIREAGGPVLMDQAMNVEGERAQWRDVLGGS